MSVFQSRNPFIVRSLAVAALVVPAVCAPGRGLCVGREINFRITDQVDPNEISEATTVFVNGRLVATFALDAEHPFGVKTVTIPVAQTYEYAVCGRIVIRAPDGHTETHVMDNGAVLPEMDGVAFEALATGNFTMFYLAPETDRSGGPPPDIRRTHVCDVPMS